MTEEEKRREAEGLTKVLALIVLGTLIVAGFFPGLTAWVLRTIGADPSWLGL